MPNLPLLSFLHVNISPSNSSNLALARNQRISVEFKHVIIIGRRIWSFMLSIAWIFSSESIITGRGWSFGILTPGRTFRTLNLGLSHSIVFIPTKTASWHLRKECNNLNDVSEEMISSDLDEGALKIYETKNSTSKE